MTFLHTTKAANPNMVFCIKRGLIKMTLATIIAMGLMAIKKLRLSLVHLKCILYN